MRLHMMAGSKEDAETVTAFFEDMKKRGLSRKATREHGRMAFRMNCRRSSRFRSPSVGSAA